MVKSGRMVACVFVLSLVVGGCASSGSTDPLDAVVELPVLARTGVQPGDQVIIAFYTSAGVELLEISGERTVDPNGELFLPFLGEVRVVGMETADVRRLLEGRYGELYSEPVVEVVVNVTVNITGAVQRAGQFFVPPSSTLVDALSRAGGVSPEVDVSIGGGASDPSQIRLVRDGMATVIDMRPLTIRPSVLELLVQSGDWLYVPRAQRSQTRETIAFWGALFSTLLTLATLIVLVTTN